MDELKKVGIEAVVEGLSQFTSGMNSINSQLGKLQGQPTLLQQAFSSVGDILGNFAGGIARIAEYTIGNLLAGAIRGAIGLMQELVQGAFDAGNEFQTLRLRLETLNFNAATESGMAYNDATAESVRLTKEQLLWLQKLAFITPYTNEDIANVYTLARSYGFADEEARKLTDATMEFTSGMGLSGDYMERIITNLGQMKAQGKITGTELRDLARGAFVPVAEILDKVARKMEETGSASLFLGDDITKTKDAIVGYQEKLAIAIQKQSEFTGKTKESTRMINTKSIQDYQAKIAKLNLELTAYNSIADGTGTITKEMFAKFRKEGIPAQEFINAFIDTVNTKFAGSSQKMARTFGAATDNVKELVKSFGGMQIFMPILDKLGEKIAGIVDAFGKTGVYEAFVGAVERIGKKLGEILGLILDLLPTGDDLAAMLIKLLTNVGDWLEMNKGTIVETAKTVIDWLGDVAEEMAKTDWDGLLKSVQNLGSAILELFGIEPDSQGNMASLSEIVARLIVKLNEFAQWIREHKDLIGWIGKIFIGYEIIMTVVNMLGALIITVVTFGLGILSTIKFIGLLFPYLLVLAALVLGVIANFMLFESLKKFMEDVFLTIGNLFTKWADGWILNTQETVKKVIKAIEEGDYAGAVGAVIEGIISLLEYQLQFILETIVLIATAMGGTFFDEFAKFFVEFGVRMYDGMKESIGKALVAFEDGDYDKAMGFFLTAIADGIKTNIGIMIDAMKEVASNAVESLKSSILGEDWASFGGEWMQQIIQSVKDALQMHSPSKVFDGIGANIVKGMALGIDGANKLAQTAMQATVNTVVNAASPAPSSVPSRAMSAAGAAVTNQNTSNYNLTINSQAKSEPILADFSMLQSLSGV